MALSCPRCPSSSRLDGSLYSFSSLRRTHLKVASFSPSRSSSRAGNIIRMQEGICQVYILSILSWVDIFLDRYLLSLLGRSCNRAVVVPEEIFSWEI